MLRVQQFKSGLGVSFEISSSGYLRRGLNLGKKFPTISLNYTTQLCSPQGCNIRGCRCTVFRVPALCSAHVSRRSFGNLFLFCFGVIQLVLSSK